MEVLYGGWGGPTPPLVTGALVLVASLDDNVHALDATTGGERWRFTAGALDLLFLSTIGWGSLLRQR